MDLTKIEPSKVVRGAKGKSVYLIGGPSTWKTTFASSFPRAIFGVTENGYNFIDGVMAQPIKNWKDFNDFIRELERPEVKAMYDTVVLDLIDKFYGYAEQYIKMTKNDGKEIGETNDFGKCYRYWRTEFERAFDRLQAAGYGLVFISHDKVITDNDGNEIGRAPDVHQNVAKVINGLVDFTFSLIKDNGIVTAYTENTPTSKSRARYFPKKFLFTFDEFEKNLEEAIDKQVQIEGITAESARRVQASEPVDFEAVQAKCVAKVTQLVEMKHYKLDSLFASITGLLGATPLSKAIPERDLVALLSIEALLDIEFSN